MRVTGGFRGPQPEGPPALVPRGSVAGQAPPWPAGQGEAGQAGLARQPARRAADGVRPRQSMLPAGAVAASRPPVPLAAVPEAVQQLFKKLNLKITRDTSPAYGDQDLLDKPARLGSGKFNKVYAVKLRRPDGSSFDGVFKPLAHKEKSAGAAEMGIPRDDPQIAMRNIATQAYGEKLLGIDVVADTRVGVIKAGRRARLFGPRLGLVMEKAQGLPAARTPLATLDRADVRAEVTRLQLLDHLTGQGDRHQNNYFIDVRNGRARVTGIDNDQSFGRLLTDPDGIRNRHDPEWHSFVGTRMPPVVDIDMASRINALTEDRIRRELGDKLGPGEVDAAVSRHQGVKQHIANLALEGRVIDARAWSEPWVTKLLKPDISYVGRERVMAVKRQRLSPDAAVLRLGW